MSEPEKTVETTGTYVLPDGTPVHLKEGAPLPEGATLRDTEPLPGMEHAEDEPKSSGKALPTKDAGRAPEDKAKQ